MNLRIVGALVAVSMFAGVAVACSDDGDQTPEEMQAQLCSDLDALQTSIDDIRGLTDESTVDDLRAARLDVRSALDDVLISAEDIADAETEDLEAAAANLESAVGDVDENQTVPAALEELQPEIDALVAAHDELRSSVSCTEGAGSSEETPQ